MPSFAGTINVGIAGVKGVYTGKLKLDEIRPPEHYKMLVDGKGKQGFMRGSGTLDLLPKDGDAKQRWSNTPATCKSAVR